MVLPRLTMDSTKKIILLSLVIFSFRHVMSSFTVCESQFYRISGTLNIIGMINVHSGENCTSTNFVQQQIVQNMITAVKFIRNISLIPNIDIGLTIFDICSSDPNEIINNLDCMKPFEIGSIISVMSEGQLDAKLGYRSVPFSLVAPQKLLGGIISKVIYDLQLSPIQYLAKGEHEVSDTVDEITKRKMCIYNIGPLHEMKNIKPPKGTVIAIGKFEEIKSAITSSPDQNLLLVPTDGIYEPIKDVQGKLFVLLLTQVAVFEDGNSTQSEYDVELSVSKTSLMELQMVSDLVNIVKAAKVNIQAVCGNISYCKQLPKVMIGSEEKWPELVTVNSLFYQLKVLGIDPKDFEGAVLMEQNENLLKLGTVKLVDFDWTLDVSLNLSEGNDPRSAIVCGNDMNCSTCFNFHSVYKEGGAVSIDHDETQSIVVLRADGWVAALLSVSAVGITSCLSIAIFIIVRMCKKDMLEGNTGFSFLMLLSLILMYLGILPFSVNTVVQNDYYDSVLCGMKIIGTSLSYGFVFSVMLARSLMLASCDEDGSFMSHVNGYLQTVLCFFISSVQIALSLQFWAMNWFFAEVEQCRTMTEGPLFLYHLCYDMFLLFLLLCVSPFIMKSKRNYQEGGYFTFAIILCILVWILWNTAYHLFPGCSDILVCSGLVATATIILTVVFIPRTYLMMTGIVRDHLVSSLPALGHTSSASIVDVNYRSNQALYDSVNIRGQVNPNYYTERPTTPSTSKMDDKIETNHYERYDASPPLIVTRF